MLLVSLARLLSLSLLSLIFFVLRIYIPVEMLERALWLLEEEEALCQTRYTTHFTTLFSNHCTKMRRN